MRKILLLTIPFMLVSSLAHADLMPEPCEGATAGDTCQDLMGNDGTCVDSGGTALTCDTNSGAGGSGGTTGSGGAGTDDDDGENGDDGGCSFGGPAGNGGGASLLMLAGLAFAIRQRRR